MAIEKKDVKSAAAKAKTVRKPRATSAKKKTAISKESDKERIAKLEECLANTQNDYGKCLEKIINMKGDRSRGLGYILYGLACMGITLDDVVKKCMAIKKTIAQAEMAK